MRTRIVTFGAVLSVVTFAFVTSVRSGGAAASHSRASSSTSATHVRMTSSDDGRADLVAAITSTTELASAEIAGKFVNMSAGPARFDLASVRVLRENVYGAVRSDGTPCFYATLGERGGRGFCLASFVGQPVVTTATVIRQYDSPTAPFEMFVSGLARANVQSVTFTLRDGRQVTTSVVHRVFSVRLTNTEPGDVLSVEVTYTSGQSKELLPLSNYAPVVAPTGRGAPADLRSLRSHESK